MKYRKLGRTDIDVSTVCLGCWAMVGDFTWGPQNRQDALAAIRAAIDAGVNFFDTAEGYGRGESEKLLAEALSAARKDVIIATKVSRGNLAGGKLKQACEDSLRRLRTDYIDLYQLHWPNRDVPLCDTLGAMAELQAAGKVRHIGVSNFGASYLAELPASAGMVSNQLCYSLLWRPIEREVQQACVEADMDILCYSPLCQGLLTGKFATADEVPPARARTRLFADDRPHCRHGEPGCEENVFNALAEIRELCESLGRTMVEVSLAWLLAQQAVVSVIAGARNAAQAIQNAKAAEVALADDVVAKLAAITGPVKDYAGSNCDLWQSESRMER